MIENLFWLFLVACAIAGITLLIRGFVLYKETFKSKMRFLISGLAFLAPRETILIFIIWYFELSGKRVISILIAFFEILILLIFFASLLGKKASRVTRNVTMGGSIFFLLHLLVLTILIGTLTLLSGSSLMKLFQWSDGFRYVENSGEITIMQYSGYDVDIVIPSEIDEKPVTVIAEEAFRMNPDVTSVIIPEGVTSIGDSAFEECSSLRSVTIPDSVTGIGYDAFLLCSSLKSVTIPDSVTTIEENPFASCSALTEIIVAPGNTNFVSVDEVLYSKNMERLIAFPAGRGGSVQIPDSVKYLGEAAFDGCSELTDITIPDNVRTIGAWTFAYCKSLEGISIPNGVTTIGDYAFGGCESLTSIHIPASVTSIDSGFILDCNEITEITVAPENMFFTSESGILFNKDKTMVIRCLPSKSGDVTLPDRVTIIGEDAFYMCTEITSIELPEGVTDIGTGAFLCCNNLTILTIPDSVTNIDSLALVPFTGVVIHCNEGSYAQTFAEENQIKYEINGSTKTVLPSLPGIPE